MLLTISAEPRKIFRSSFPASSDLQARSASHSQLKRERLDVPMSEVPITSSFVLKNKNTFKCLLYCKCKKSNLCHMCAVAMLYSLRLHHVDLALKLSMWKQKSFFFYLLSSDLMEYIIWPANAIVKKNRPTLTHCQDIFQMTSRASKLLHISPSVRPSIHLKPVNYCHFPVKTFYIRFDLVTY